MPNRRIRIPNRGRIAMAAFAKWRGWERSICRQTTKYSCHGRASSIPIANIVWLMHGFFLSLVRALMDANGLVRGLRKQVADRLRDDILSGRLKPGEKLAETSLVKRFGVSRAPVREALVQLTQEGLLVGHAN